MGTVTFESDSKREPPFQTIGTFWLPSDPEHVVGGQLTWNGETTEVRLAGTLGEDFAKVIHARTSGAAFTLLNPTWSGSGTLGFGPGETVIEEVWSTSIMLRGGLFGSENEQPKFTRFVLATHLLANWVDRHVRTNERSAVETLIRVTHPDPIVAHVDDFEVSLEWTHSERSRSGNFYLEVQPRLVVVMNEPVTLQEAWRNFLTPIVFLLNLCTGEADYPVSLNVSIGEDAHTFRQADVLGLPWFEAASRALDVRPFQIFMPFSAIEGQFEEVLRAWFKTFIVARPAMTEYFGGELAPSVYLEDLFARTVRGMEMWHRFVRAGTYMEPASFDALMQDLRNAVPNKANINFLEMRLRHGNGRTLRQRLDSLVKAAGDPMRYEVRDLDDFTRRCVNTRNEMTHGEKTEPALTVHQLFPATKVLRLVFHSALLAHLGVPENEVASAVRRTESWRYLAQHGGFAELQLGQDKPN